jgi:RNA polymerase sigma-70 factor (ECF subfamily)
MVYDSHTAEWHGPAEPGSTSSGLLGRVKAGESDAWARLVELYGPTIYRWCRRCGVAADDAADVCQEVFSSLAANIARFRREKPGDSFRGWLWTVTRNKAQDHFRRRAGEPDAFGGSGHQDFLAGLPTATSQSSGSSGPPADHALVHRALEIVRKEVEPSSWQAFWRTAVEGHSSAEVARDLGLTPSAVRQAKCRLLKRLRQELEG